MVEAGTVQIGVVEERGRTAARAVELGVLNCRGVASLLARKRDPAAAKDSGLDPVRVEAVLALRIEGSLRGVRA